MRLYDLTLNEYVDKFGKMTERYFVQYLKGKGQNVDWVEKMRWTNYNAMFNKLVDAGKIKGPEANSRYWIRAFRDDVDNVGKFISMVQNDGELSESVNLNEKLLEIDDDVDRIYDKYFKEVIGKINNKEFKNSNEFYRYMNSSNRKVSLDTLIDEGIIQSPELITLNEKHKGILFDMLSTKHNGGIYFPKQRKLALTINQQPIEILIDNNYDLDKIKKIVGNRYRSFINEFSEKKVKGTIHHELAHLYDNVENNQHISKWIDDRQKNKGNKLDRYMNPVNVTPFEIEGVIHTIKQFKRHTDDWDSLTFDDILQDIPTLSTIKMEYFPGRPELWEKWKKLVLKRMAREGLLGDNMR